MASGRNRKLTLPGDMFAFCISELSVLFKDGLSGHASFYIIKCKFSFFYNGKSFVHQLDTLKCHVMF